MDFPFLDNRSVIIYDNDNILIGMLPLSFFMRSEDL